MDSEKKEKKEKRLNLVLKPSVARDIKKIVYMKRTSVNKIIGDYLENYIKDNIEELKRYDEVFSEKK